jgi:multidrug efflux pump subunit AcrB
MPLFCPRCQARLDATPDSSDEPVTCPSCQASFSTGEPTRYEPQDAGAVPWYLVGAALLPLIIPAVAIPLHLLLGGLAGAALWGAMGACLAGACLAVVCRRRWTGLARALVVLGLAGLGFAVLVGALAVDFLFGPEAARPLPAVAVEVVYPGANAQTVADTVAAPIEQQIIGVEGMVAMRSQCRDDGSYTLTVTFRRGTDLDLARVLVINRESLAEPMLPEAVKRRGTTIRTASPGVLMILSVFSPDGSRDTLYLSNYATLQLRDELLRVPGVGDITFVGQRDYSLRVWLDQDKLAARDLTAAEVVRAIEQQNVRVAAGPARDGALALHALGGLADADQLENCIVKSAPDGAVVHLRDVGRVELGGGPPQGDVLLDGKPGVALVVHPLPQARPRELSASLQDELNQLRARLPAGVEFDTAYDFTANLEAASWQATPGYLLLDVDLPAGASPERRLSAAERCATIARQVQGVQGSLVMTEHPFDRHPERTCVLVRLGPDYRTTAEREPLMQTVRTRLREVEEAAVRLRDLSGPGRCWSCRYPIELAVYGPEADRVREFATKLAARLRQEPGLTDLWAASDAPPHPELSVTIDAAAARAHGVAIAEINNTLQTHFGGVPVGEFDRFGRTWEVTVKADPRAGGQAEALKNLRVRGADRQLVPLSALAAVREVEALPAAERFNTFPMVAITANPAPGVSLTEARALCESRAGEVRRELGLPAEYRVALP